MVREAAEAVISIQQAAVKSRQGGVSLEDVQAAVDAYAQILESVTGSSSSSGAGGGGGLKPGDEVVVPSMGLVNPLPTTIAKVRTRLHAHALLAATLGGVLWGCCLECAVAAAVYGERMSCLGGAEVLLLSVCSSARAGVWGVCVAEGQSAAVEQVQAAEVQVRGRVAV